MSVAFPSGPVSLNSSLYITRPQIEELAYQEINKPGSLIRIKAPKQMGKTSLVLRLLDRTQQAGFHTVYLDFLQADETVFNSLDKFLRWFCANVSYQLQLKPMLDDYWDEDIGSKVSCTIYFQGYLLEQIDRPLVLALNEVNRIFEYPKIAQDFLALLRSWYEEAKQIENLEKLRILVVYSTDVYITLNINQSPFNIGLPIKLPELSLDQVQELAQCYGLDWTDGSQAKTLMAMVGGHPYLVQLALYHLTNSPQKSLNQLLGEAATITGIYHTHLQELLATLQRYPELVSAIKEVVNAEGSVQLNPLLAYKLESLGLVKLEGNQCSLSYPLYRLYFTSQTLEGDTWRKQIEELQKQNQELYRLRYLDDLTQLAKREYFNLYLEQYWQKLVDEQAPLSLILCDIDYLKIYNNTYGYEAGNDCLRLVARAICQLVTYPDELVARYEDDKFALLLPRLNALSAFSIAEKNRDKVKQLAIVHGNKFTGFPSSVVSLSLGVACTIPQRENSPTILIQAAEKALTESKIHGRDRTSVSTTLNYGYSLNS
ncbi:MAG TPA: diguanylate cyclase [Cyanobacteria bacterium UBA12227]|nr:diguanylate cyclase [Cyanobacteria bacterium UBA12227]HAX85019.1 diguanylate cyclase [Cyanobacteria bacterium UBA11370]HBY78855.1 diguanylate cyclase [Cyanobacteria bacterium UBA11148]